MALMWPLYGYPSKSLYQNAAASVEVALPYDRTVCGALPCRTRTGLQASTVVRACSVLHETPAAPLPATAPLILIETLNTIYRNF